MAELKEKVIAFIVLKAGVYSECYRTASKRGSNFGIKPVVDSIDAAQGA